MRPRPITEPKATRPRCSVPDEGFYARARHRSGHEVWACQLPSRRIHFADCFRWRSKTENSHRRRAIPQQSEKATQAKSKWCRIQKGSAIFFGEEKSARRVKQTEA